MGSVGVSDENLMGEVWGGMESKGLEVCMDVRMRVMDGLSYTIPSYICTQQEVTQPA